MGLRRWSFRIHDAEQLRATHPGLERFKMAAQKNVQRWWNGTLIRRCGHGEGIDGQSHGLQALVPFVRGGGLQKRQKSCRQRLCMPACSTMPSSCGPPIRASSASRWRRKSGHGEGIDGQSHGLQALVPFVRGGGLQKRQKRVTSSCEFGSSPLLRNLKEG
jgi:hypothetical protein